MINQIYKWLNRKYPQNYIIKKPYTGIIILSLTNFGFMALYKPLNAHEANPFSFEITMAIYSLLSAIFVLIFVKILKTFNFFSSNKDWTFLKELAAITIILLGMGITIYFIGFFIEAPTARWNWPTFLDSCKNAFLIGILPFTFFTVINYRFLLSPGEWINEEINATNSIKKISEEIINISSKLKKEELNFYPSQFVYAASDGNYVDFYLEQNDQIIKETIRNSIGSIEQQLSEIPYFIKTHRAFIVNLKKVQKKQGNTLGYHLILEGTKLEIPVSRQKIQIFNQRLEQFLR